MKVTASRAVVLGGVLVIVITTAYWLKGEPERPPNNPVANGMTVSYQHLDDWGKGELSSWELILKRYVTALSQKNQVAIGQLLDPADRLSARRLDSVIGDFSASARPGIRTILMDNEFPNYTSFCPMVRVRDGS